MERFKHMWHWMQQHPYVAAGIVGLFVLILLWLFWPRKQQAAASGGASNLDGYYAAVGAQTQAGAAVQIATIQGQQKLASDLRFADTVDRQTSATLAATLASTGSAEALGHDSFATNRAIATSQNNLTLDLAREEVSRHQLDVTAADNANARATNLASMQAGYALDTARLRAGVELSGQHYDYLNRTTAEQGASTRSWYDYLKAQTADVTAQVLAQFNVFGPANQSADTIRALQGR